MNVSSTLRASTSPKREAYTLIELLVVVAIIGVLVGLVASAVFRVIQGQRSNITETRIKKVHVALQRQWSAAHDTAKRNIRVPFNVTFLARSPGESDARRVREKVIWVKLQMRRQFPQTYEEAVRPWTLNYGGRGLLTQNDLDAHPLYKTKIGPVLAKIEAEAQLAQQQGRPIPPRDLAAESSACLLLALSINRRSGVTFNPDEALGPDALRDTNKDGLLEIVDGWEKPIAFYRWGMNAELDSICKSGSRLDCDDEDPERSLMNKDWNYVGNLGADAFNQELHKIRAGSAPRSFYTEPTLVSGGPDKTLGLGRWMESQTGTAAEDNIFSFNLR